MATLKIWYGTAKPMLEFAEKYHGWHTFKQDRATITAVKALERKGYLKIAGDQFCINYPKG